jgi:hypothetical protein
VSSLLTLAVSSVPNCSARLWRQRSAGPSSRDLRTNIAVPVLFSGDLFVVTKPKAPRSPTVRSRVTNGTRLLPMSDGRCASSRRFKDLLESRPAFRRPEDTRSGRRPLAVMDERHWQIDKNQKFDIGEFGVVCDRLGRLFDRLGLERRSKLVEESAVVTHFKRRVQNHRAAP